MEKYYIASQSAETESQGIVHLTEAEYKAVLKFLNQVHKFSSGYCGYCYISEKAYDSKYEAEIALYK